MSVITKCLSGFYQILQSLSGTFSLLTLLVIGVVTFHAPMIGAAALAAFATTIPGILAFCEHKETLQQVAMQAVQPATITTVTTSNLPPNGQIS
jgi:hypothetical protein